MIVMAAFYDMSFVYACVLRLYCVYLFLTSLEYLSIIQQFSDGGIFSWKIMKINVYPRVLQSRLGFLFNKSGVFFMLLTRLSLSIYLVFVPLSPLTVYLAAVIVVISLLFAVRNSIGNDGTDQMNMIISVTLFISFLTHNPVIEGIGLYFIAAQSILAYVVAGTAKLFSGKWRSGVAVIQIMNTETFGFEPVARYLQAAPPVVSRILSWNIMSFEVLFFTTLFLPYPYLFLFLAWGLSFHLFNAFVMGLNHFFWVFLATYPAIIYTNMALQHFWFH